MANGNTIRQLFPYLAWYFLLISYLPVSILFQKFFFLPVQILTYYSPILIFYFLFRIIRQSSQKAEFFLAIGPLVFLLGTIVDFLQR